MCGCLNAEMETKKGRLKATYLLARSSPSHRATLPNPDIHLDSNSSSRIDPSTSILSSVLTKHSVQLPGFSNATSAAGHRA